MVTRGNYTTYKVGVLALLVRGLVLHFTQCASVTCRAGIFTC